MKSMRWICVALLPLMVSATALDAQGKGHGKDKDHGNKGKGNDRKEVARDLKEQRKDARDFVKDAKRGDKKDKDRDRVTIVTESGGNVGFREFMVSERKGRRIAGLAVASAARRGNDDAFVITPVGNRVQVLNRNGAVLVDFDDDRELGNWKVVSEPFRDKKGSPSFCRSGSGHPVWGRQWCIDKGFGLGTDDDLRWSRIIDPSNVVLTRPTTGDLTRDVLADVLGSVVLNRLATHAVTLGFQEPLSGRWLGDTPDSGPRVLLLSSGTRPVAEVVDLNRDNNADLVLVTVRK